LKLILALKRSSIYFIFLSFFLLTQINGPTQSIT